MATRQRPPARVDDPRYWRARAAAAAEAAERVIDPQARRTLITISRSYEELARRTQIRIAASGARRVKPPTP